MLPAFIALAILLSCTKKVDQRYKDIRIKIDPNHKWAYVIEKNGRRVNLTDHIYDDARHFESKGIAQVFYNGKYALVDLEFKFISDFYDEMSSDINKDLIAVAKGGKYGFINSEGQEVTKPIYANVNFPFQSEKFVSVSRDGKKWALLNSDNEAVIDFKYNCAIEYKNDFVITCNDQTKYGCIDLDEDIIIPFMYDRIEMIKDDKFIVKDKERAAIINTDNKKLFECNGCRLFETTYLTHLVIDEDKKKGLVDYNGNLISTPQYDQLDEEKFGFIVYTLNRSKGLIDLKGKELLSNQYELLEVLSEKEARGFTGEKWEMIQIGDK